MNILQFALLRGGFTPAELGLPESVLHHIDNQPLQLAVSMDPALYTSTGNWNKQEAQRAADRRRYRRATAPGAAAAKAHPAKRS